MIHLNTESAQNTNNAPRRHYDAERALKHATQPLITPAPQSEGHAAWLLVFAAWFIAAIATLGALFFGEVMKVPTCSLCWYQRIFMFPLVIILPLGLFPYDPKIMRYGLTLAAVGGCIALFHVLLVHGVIPESVQPCSQGVPCSQTFVRYFGLVTIPLLALVAFTTIIGLLAAAWHTDNTDKGKR